MDAQRFDQLTQRLAFGITRRRFVKSAVLLCSAAIIGSNRVSAAACEIDADCGDLAKCDNGFCFEIDYLPGGSACDGSIPCEDELICQGGICVAPAICQSITGNPCDPAAGCCPGLVCSAENTCQVEPIDPPDDGDTPTDNSGGGGSGGGGGGGSGSGGEDSYNAPAVSSGPDESQGSAAAAPVRLPTTGVIPEDGQTSSSIGKVATAAAASGLLLRVLERFRGESPPRG